MDFMRKARWVLHGHKILDPDGLMYAGVVSTESVRNTFTYAALNNLAVWAADVQETLHSVWCGIWPGECWEMSTH
eukprot:4056011-Ditylum_brightwellii.AAC.1